MEDLAAKPGEEHLWTQEAERDLVVASLKVCLREIEGYIRVYRRDMWYSLSEACLEKHQDRVAKIRLTFIQKRTGLPF